MKKILLIIMFVLVMPTAVFAASSDGTKETDELMSALPSDVANEVKAAKTKDGYELDSGLKNVLRGLKSRLGEILLFGVECAVKLLAVSTVCGLIGSALVHPGTPGATVLNISGAGCVVAVGISQVGGIFSRCSELINQLNVFSKAFIVSMSAATAASGSPIAALSKQTAALLGADILITFFSKTLLPCIYIYLGIRVLQIITENQMFARLSAFIKVSVTNVLKYLLIIYFGYISINGIVSHAADTLAKKATKTAVSTLIPVVGGVVSDGTEAVFAAAAVLKNTIGVFGVIAIVAMAAFPLAWMGVNYLILRLSAALSFSVDGGGASQAMDALADCLSLVFALCAAAVSLVMITAVVFMRSAGY